MAQIIIDREKFEKLIEETFKKGESWGVTYSTWFTPTEEDTAEKINEAKKSALKKCGLPMHGINIGTCVTCPKIAILVVS